MALRAIVAALLPALWLLASGQLLLATPSGGLNEECSAAVCVCKHAKGAPLPDISSQPSTRLLSRRVVKQSGSAEGPVLVAGAWAPAGCSALVPCFSIVSEASRELARSWQFRWRAALAPRAPSSVS